MRIFVDWVGNSILILLFISQKPEPGRPRGVLIITDRTLDTVAPFLHEFTYQAMANDLLNIENGRVYQ
jgi:syntaxin-binding protein 1